MEILLSMALAASGLALLRLWWTDFSTVDTKDIAQLQAGPKTFGKLYTHSGIIDSMTIVHHGTFTFQKYDFVKVLSRVRMVY